MPERKRLMLSTEPGVPRVERIKHLYSNSSKYRAAWFDPAGSGPIYSACTPAMRANLSHFVISAFK